MLHAHVKFPLVLGSDVLRKERVLETLLGGGPLVWVPLEHLEDQVDGLSRSIRDDRL